MPVILSPAIAMSARGGSFQSVSGVSTCPPFNSKVVPAGIASNIATRSALTASMAFSALRGVLKLMPKVIYRLWKDDHKNLLILPGSLPPHDGSSRNELTYCFPSGLRCCDRAGYGRCHMQELAIAAVRGGSGDGRVGSTRGFGQARVCRGGRISRRISSFEMRSNATLSASGTSRWTIPRAAYFSRSGVLAGAISDRYEV